MSEASRRRLSERLRAGPSSDASGQRDEPAPGTEDDLEDDEDTEMTDLGNTEGNPPADPATAPSAPVVALSEDPDPAHRAPANIDNRGLSKPVDAETQAQQGTPQRPADHERLSGVAQSFNPTRSEINEGMQPLVEGDDSDLLPALRWALYLLMHPAEQWEFCDIHGRVPVTHMCSGHQNPHYAALLKTVVGTPEEVEARQQEEQERQEANQAR